jgi:tight adherence protein B
VRKLLGVLAAALAVPTAAAAGISIRSVDDSAYPRIAVTVVTGKPSTEAPTLVEEGSPAAGLLAQNLGDQQSIVLAIDRSRSMVGKPLDDALAAARAFVALKQPTDRIAIVAFGSRAVALTDFSSSTIDADLALRSISVAGRQGTALYDAIAVSARALAREEHSARTLIVVTDGRDVSSNATAGRAEALARAAHVGVYGIGIEGPQFAPGTLRAIARHTGGTYRSAKSSAALADVYRGLARELRRSWRLEYVTAAQPGEHIALRVAVPGQGAATTTLELKGSSARSKTFALPAALYSPLGTLLVALFAALVVVAGFVLVVRGKPGEKLQARIAPHLGLPRLRRSGLRRPAPRAALAGVFRATEQVLGQTRQWRGIERLLQRADIPLTPAEFVYTCVGSGLLVGLLVAAAFGSGGVLLAFVLGALIPAGVVWFKGARRRAAFERQLPDLLMSVASSLKAGHGFKQAVQALAEEDVEPASKELRRALSETRLGRPIEAALAEMAERLGSKNFSFVITSVTIQTQVGGSLAGLFDTVAETVRKRQQFARRIRSLTAMGRMSAYVLVGLPFFVALAITALNPEYMHPLYHSSTGHKLIIAMLVMMAIGASILKKIVSFRG